MPPCAVINGMHLNELECRLLAPRLAFQKLMQAPRGRQLKINGNQEMHWKPKLYIFSKYCNTTDAGIGNAVRHVHMAHK